jgi:hypothetical protein
MEASMKFFGLTIAVLCLLCADVKTASAESQERILMTRSLSGLQAFYPVFEVESSNCAPTIDQVQARILYVTQHSRMNMAASNSVSGASSGVYATVLLLSNCAAASVHLGVFTATHISSTNAATYAEIWSRTTLLSGSNLQSRILMALEEQAKELVVNWSEANPDWQ